MPLVTAPYYPGNPAALGPTTITGAAQVTGALEIDGDLNHDGALAGLRGVPPVALAAAIVDAAGGGTVDAECRTAVNSLLAAMRLQGAVTP